MTPAEQALVDAVLAESAFNIKGKIVEARNAVLLEREDPARRERAFESARTLRAAYDAHEASLAGLSPATRVEVDRVAWPEKYK